MVLLSLFSEGVATSKGLRLKWVASSLVLNLMHLAFTFRPFISSQNKTKTKQNREMQIMAEEALRGGSGFQLFYGVLFGVAKFRSFWRRRRPTHTIQISYNAYQDH